MELKSRPALAWPWHLLIAVGLVAAASLTGNAATLPNIPTWYAGLVKPGFNPPNWIFGPVWTLLYILMAWSFFRVLRIAPHTQGRGSAIAAFVAQMILNAAWSIAFFGAHSPLGGLVVIGALWLAILASIVTFSRLDRPAAWLLAPYIAWVSFAAVLNVAIVRLNS